MILNCIWLCNYTSNTSIDWNNKMNWKYILKRRFLTFIMLVAPMAVDANEQRAEFDVYAVFIVFDIVCVIVMFVCYQLLKFVLAKYVNAVHC